MIDYLSNDELDIEKYDNCISKAINTRVYAYSWYLNIVCDTWDVLVKDDYQAVMPLPKRRKFGIHYVYLPPWTQQLGIFALNNLEESMVKAFLTGLPKKFKLIDIFFNSDIVINVTGISQRKNFILPLRQPYELLRKQFSKGRKSNIKQAENYGLDIIKNYNHDEIIDLFKKNKGANINMNRLEYNVLSKLMTYALPLNFAESLAVFSDKKELIAGAFFLKDTHRITYLFSSVNEEGRTKQAISFLLDTMIKTNAEADLILDFEGSMIKELASFFKSFGAEEETYLHLKKYLL